jgi:hypothetical protein
MLTITYKENNELIIIASTGELKEFGPLVQPITAERVYRFRLADILGYDETDISFKITTKDNLTYAFPIDAKNAQDVAALSGLSGLLKG